MNKIMPALAVAVCITAFALASPHQKPNTSPDDAQSPVSGRFQINTEASSDPILLDTATGDMWTLTESTNLVEARMVAWAPMRRIFDRAELEAWAKEGRERHDQYLATLKAQSLATLEQKLDLGVDHPEVTKLANEIEEHPFFEHVTDSQLEAAKQQLRSAGTDTP